MTDTNTFTTRYFENFWTEFLMLNHPLKNNWQYVTANLQTYNGHRYKIAPISLAFRINRQASPEKCFDYIMTERYRQYCKEFKIADMITTLPIKSKFLNSLLPMSNQDIIDFTRRNTRLRLIVLES
jgi:hypothetical protein